jgi:hypothetical protein
MSSSCDFTIIEHDREQETVQSQRFARRWHLLSSISKDGKRLAVQKIKTGLRRSIASVIDRPIT